MNLPEHPCPICRAPIAFWERYPRMVCADCAQAAVDRDGHPVTLRNTGPMGTGLELIAGPHRLLDAAAEAHPIYIRGIECRAQEHRFGGIVVQIADKRDA